MHEHIGVGVAKKPLLTRNVDSAEHAPAPGGKGVDIEAVAYAHGHWESLP